MNKVRLLGRLTKESEVRFTETTNNIIRKFTLAVNRKYAKQGEELPQLLQSVQEERQAKLQRYGIENYNLYMKKEKMKIAFLKGLN